MKQGHMDGRTLTTRKRALNVCAAWPLLPMSDGSATGIYQQVADTTGIVFVRYGPEDTVEHYVGRLGGMLTQVTVVSDTPAVVSGQTARRVTIRIVALPREAYDGDTRHGVTHRTVPEERTLITVLAFSHRGYPVLAGYRMPEEWLDRYRETLEASLGSISLT